MRCALREIRHHSNRLDAPTNQKPSDRSFTHYSLTHSPVARWVAVTMCSPRGSALRRSADSVYNPSSLTPPALALKGRPSGLRIHFRNDHLYQEGEAIPQSIHLRVMVVVVIMTIDDDDDEQKNCRNFQLKCAHVRKQARECVFRVM